MKPAIHSVLLLAMFAGLGTAHAQTYPGKPIRLVVGFTPGGGVDINARLFDQGAEPLGNTPEEFSKLLREEVEKWAEVVKISGAKVD